MLNKIPGQSTPNPFEENQQTPLKDKVTAKAEVDSKTIYTAALVLKKQEIEHLARAHDTRLSEEARKAHRFVAVNLNFMLTTILMLQGISHQDAVTEGLAIHEVIVKEIEKQAMKGKPGVVQ